jgi:hypothetical protein
VNEKCNNRNEKPETRNQKIKKGEEEEMEKK